ncbi:hypothetical protein C4K04_2955 [Pseudomonas chlororaphis]|uniref:Uncharacterized protein n=1 Tax=Pseudomonas chlororaphis TaxID=587753 RepID=A0A3G7TNC1_9PSED|nr:hypothetical protein [Pseudomonas chlororaphis]AZE48627.1 hypothetical protein C4K04_2955 [Pseudomonas chlororaphis]
MGLDIHLEADERLSLNLLTSVARTLGGLDRVGDDSSVFAHFPSGLSVSAKRSFDEQAIYPEDTQGLSFPVVVRCDFRIKGPAPEGSSPLDDLKMFVEAIAAESDAHFLVSFQYESLMYRRDQSGLHASWLTDGIGL